MLHRLAQAGLVRLQLGLQGRIGGLVGALATRAGFGDRQADQSVEGDAFHAEGVGQALQVLQAGHDLAAAPA